MHPRLYSFYDHYAPIVGRILLGGLFLAGASAKIPGSGSFAMEVAMTAGKGIPYAAIFVTLAFALEAIAGLAIIFGIWARAAAFVLAVFTLALTIIFHSDFSDPMQIGQFLSHLGLVAGLLFISVYGARTWAVRKDG